MSSFQPIIEKGFFDALNGISYSVRDSQDTVQRFCRQFLDLHISPGTIQKVINRVSEAIKPHYEVIRDQVYQSQVNPMDETPWGQAGGVLQRLWVMGNFTVAFFLIHTNRNKNPTPSWSK